MTFTEQRLQKIAGRIHMLRRLAQADGRDLTAETKSTDTKSQVGTEQQHSRTRLISENQFAVERDAFLQAFRSIGREAVALPGRFRTNHPEVPWDTMAAWADDIPNFSHTLCEQWLQSAFQAEAAIIRHSGVDTKIQQAVMSQIQRKTQITGKYGSKGGYIPLCVSQRQPYLLEFYLSRKGEDYVQKKESA